MDTTKVDHQSRLQGVHIVAQYGVSKSSSTENKNLYFNNKDTCTRDTCVDIAVSVWTSGKNRTQFL